MDPSIFLIQVLNGVQYGLLLFLVASGLTLVFGTMGVINLAHGSFYMLGAYLAWSLADRLSSFWAAIAVGVPLSVAFGLALEWLLIQKLYGRDHLYQVLLTYGLILMIEEMRSLVWGDDVHSVPPPEPLGGSVRLTETLSYPVYRLWISAVCLAVAAAMYVVIRRTRLGMMIRAGAFNREMTQALGINLGLLNRLVFALGIGGAALAGMIAAPISSVFPGMGSQVLIISFVVVVIGGIGSLKGALVAAILIGLVDTFGKVTELEIAGVHVLPALSGTAIYLLMGAVLVWRPEGIFGRKP